MRARKAADAARPAGERQFTALLREVVTFDEKLCARFSERDLMTLRKLLGRLRANVARLDTT